MNEGVELHDYVHQAFHHVCECQYALHKLVTGEDANATQKHSTRKWVEDLSTEYASLVDLGYLELGGDKLATGVVEFGEIIATSNGRLIAQLALRALQNLAEHISAEYGMYSIGFQMPEELDEIAKLDKGEVSSLASGGDLDDVILHRLLGRHIAELDRWLAINPCTPEQLRNSDATVSTHTLRGEKAGLLRAMMDYPINQVVTAESFIEEHPECFRNEDTLVSSFVSRLKTLKGDLNRRFYDLSVLEGKSLSGFRWLKKPDKM